MFASLKKAPLGTWFLMWISLISHQALAQQADRGGYLKAVVELMETQWPSNRTLRIVSHGHSVPAGYFKTPHVDSLHAYPHLLHVGLKEAFPHAVINVIVTAIGGENAESGAKRFVSEVLSHRPDILLIDYALNDRGIGLEKAARAWTEMITTAKKKGVKVVLLTPTPDTRSKWDHPDDPLYQHAAQIRRLAREHQVGLVDSYQRFQDAVAAGTPLDQLMSQINHPNHQGHQLVAEGLLEWFLPLASP